MQAIASEFAAEAQRFLDYLSESPEIPDERVDHLAHRLVSLYSAALRLPLVEPGSAEPDEAQIPPVDPPLVSSIDSYWLLYGPESVELGKPDVVAGSLRDDLGDISRDLLVGFQVYEPDDPDAVASAVWEWRFSFRSHWGRHLVDALGTVHELVANRQIGQGIPREG